MAYGTRFGRSDFVLRPSAKRCKLFDAILSRYTPLAIRSYPQRDTSLLQYKDECADIYAMTGIGLLTKFYL